MFAAYPDPKSNAASVPENIGEALFELLEHRVMAAQQARAAGACRQSLQGRAHGLRQVRMLGESEVVVRHEIDSVREAHLAEQPRAPRRRQSGREPFLKFLPRVHD